MTRAEFAAQLETTKLPVFYDHAKVGTAVPFLTYTWDYDNFLADNKAYQRIANVTVTHYHAAYSDGADIKAVLDENELFWNCETYYDSNEKVYIDTYTMEVLANG